jgi:hypothetical protein
MKKKDFAVIGAIIVFSAVVSLLISTVLFSSPSNIKQQVEVVQPIKATFEPPDTRYFNNKSIDPTTSITTGQDGNTNPFKN